MNDLENCSGDYRTPDKLVSGGNITTDDVEMWLAPFYPGDKHVVTVNLSNPTEITAIKVLKFGLGNLMLIYFD